MSTGKSLSNGTLSLRFMQNALRAKQQAAVDLERAKVKDEAEWEVSKEVRESLGLASGSTDKTRQTVIQEPSYLPFLFPSLRTSGPSADNDIATETSTPNVNGRRTFAKGREIVSTSPSVDGPGDENIKQENSAAESSEALMEQPKSRRRARGPGGGPLVNGTQMLARLDQAGRRPTKESLTSGVPVLSMISGETSAAVGMDMRQMRKLKGKEVSAATGDDVKPFVPDNEETTNGIGKGQMNFLRPTGVDSPAASSASGKKSRKRELDEDGRAPKKSGSESVSITDASENLRQATKKKKKKKQNKAGSAIPSPGSEVVQVTQRQPAFYQH